MKFEDALSAMREGKKAKLKGWQYPIMIKEVDEIVFCHEQDNTPFIAISHILNGEWEIVE